MVLPGGLRTRMGSGTSRRRPVKVATYPRALWRVGPVFVSESIRAGAAGFPFSKVSMKSR